MQCPATNAIVPKRLLLPRSSTRIEKHYSYAKIVTGLRKEEWGTITYEGEIRAPGAVIDLASLPRPAVVIECAGRVGIYKRGRHQDILYLVWRFDFESFEWVEVARAQAPDWRWTAAVFEAVRQTLFPQPNLIDISQKGRGVAEKIAHLLDGELDCHIPEVRRTALHSLMELVYGRLANCA